MSLTEKKIRDAKAGDATRIEWDGDVKGLGLRITSAGVKSYILDYRADGRKRRMTLGRTSHLNLAKAREAAAETLVKVRAGHDPLAEAASRKALPTVAEGVEHFLTVHLPRKRAKGNLSERTETEYTRQANRYILPKLGKKRIRDVTKGDVERMLSKLPPVMANRVCALVSSMFTQFEHLGWRPQHTNPARGIERAREEARDRTLSEKELAALGAVLQGMEGNPGAVLAIRLAAVTGLRIGEIQNMRWDDIDFQTGAVILPKTKTGRRIHTLPSAALILLSETTQIGACVIPGRNPDTPLDYRSVQRHWVLACKAAEVEGARLHDLRRTIVTEAAALGVGAHLLRDFVGHKTTAMADRYARRAGAPLTELRERMGANMAAKMDGMEILKIKDTR